MPRYFAFPMGQMFQSGDPLAEWLVTLALAMNDLTVVHVRLDEDQTTLNSPSTGIDLRSHFTEAALFLGGTADLEQVASFMDSLPPAAREKYTECLAARPVRDALRDLADERGVIRSARIRDARTLFADDVVATIFAEELGGLDAIAKFEARVATGVTAFTGFANLTLDEHLTRARTSGTTVEQVEPVDPGDLRQGWRAAQ